MKRIGDNAGAGASALGRLFEQLVYGCLRVGDNQGTFHSISRKHLPNYLNEFQFRWNTRKMDDGERVSAAIKQIDGKRLQYRESVDNPPYLPELTGQMEAPFEQD